MNIARTAGACRIGTLFVAGLVTAMMVNAQTIERAGRPYVETPALPFAPAPALAADKRLNAQLSPPIALPVGAPPVPSPIPVKPDMRLYEIMSTDINVKSTFLRWADAEKRTVIWNLDNDIPIDATGSFDAQNLAEAMTTVAQAFADKKVPFVIREYDNAIVVIPRWQGRP